jgi:hypothetical protein
VFFDITSEGNGFDIEISPSLSRGQSVRFGFSIEVLQAGRRIAGMRSGANCVDRLFRRSDGALRPRAICSHPGFAGRP